jgi:hypothetical protein
MLIEDRLRNHVADMKNREAKMAIEIDILLARLDTLKTERKSLEIEVPEWEGEAIEQAMDE